MSSILHVFAWVSSRAHWPWDPRVNAPEPRAFSIPVPVTTVGRVHEIVGLHEGPRLQVPCLRILKCPKFGLEVRNDLQSPHDDGVGRFKISRSARRSRNGIHRARWTRVNEVKVPLGKRAGIEPRQKVTAYRWVCLWILVQ